MKNSSGFKFYSTKFYFNTKKRIEIYEQIMAMMNEGMPIVNVVSDLAEIYRGENKSDPRVYILQCWKKAMENNGSIIKEVSRWVPESEVVMFKTAEESGEWVRCLESLIFQLEKQDEIVKVIRSEMFYPVFLTAFLIGILAGFGGFGVPMLIEMLPLSSWPEFSRPLYLISTFVYGNAHWVAIGIAIFLVVIFRLQSKYVGRYRKYLDLVPPFNIYKAMQGASFLISLAALLRSGIPIIESVSIINKNSSPWLKVRIRDIKKAFDKGESGASALISAGKDSMFTRDVRVQVKAYSKLAQMDKAMNKIGVVAINITVQNVKMIVGLIKLSMVFMVAMSIVWIYASFAMVSQMATQGF